MRPIAWTPGPLSFLCRILSQLHTATCYPAKTLLLAVISIVEGSHEGSTPSHMAICSYIPASKVESRGHHLSDKLVLIYMGVFTQPAWLDWTVTALPPSPLSMPIVFLLLVKYTS